jgi:hypothetical protein
MKKISLLLFALFLCFCLESTGQTNKNILTNGSFENLDTSTNKFRFTQFEIVYGWIGQSVDIYCKKTPELTNLPFPEDVNPVDGDNMIGMVLRQYRTIEILTGKLKKTLEKDFIYKLSFYYRPIKTSKKQSKSFKISYCFAENMDKLGNSPYAINDSLTCFSFFPEKSTSDWHYFEATFTPKGGENYLIIWYVFDNNIVDNDLKMYYYYLDEFKLVEDSPESTTIKR